MKLSVIPVALSLLLVTACSTSEPAAEAPTVEPVASAARATPTAEATEPAESDRGNLIKVVGQPAGLSSEEGERAVNFVVNSITVDPACTGEYAAAPENGHFVVVEMSVETTPQLADLVNQRFFPSQWRNIGSNGTTSNANLNSQAAFSCFPQAELLPSPIGPAEKAVGKVVLDVESPEGVLILEDMSSGAGWEWTYPAQ